jgi:galactokinase
MIPKIKALWNQSYGTSSRPRLFFAPGRVNLMGEYVDFNGGKVFPCALSIGTYGLIAKRNDRNIRMISGNFPDVGIIESSLDDLANKKQDHWANYVKGVVELFVRLGKQIDVGFDLAIYGDLPNSSGLSSSASVEVLTGVMLNQLYDLHFSPVEIAVYGKEVENKYIGVNCGIMDQFVIAVGKANHAILLDTATLAYEAVPLRLDEYEILICNSKVKRGLVDSKYNERRADCDAAVRELKRHVDIDYLCDLTPDEFSLLAHHLNGDPLKRARHAITENDRTMEATRRLKTNDFIGFGQLLTATHVSLRDDFEVSCKELDKLVELALDNGSIGSRMTGAGFGGCTVNIVKKENRERFTREVSQGYNNAFGFDCEIYVAAVADGAKELNFHE